MSSNTMPTSNETTCPPAPKTLSNTTESLIVNLSKRSLTETEKSVLELGLTFCPSQKNLNKEQLALDLFNLFVDLSYENTSFITLLNPSPLGMRIKLLTKKMRDLTYPGKILTHTGIPTK